MATPNNPPPLLGGTAIKPVERHGLEAIKYFFHNPDTGEVMTRTPKSWALIFIFYVIYYSCLAAFWAMCFAVFITTLSYEEPKWLTDNGIIGKSPGLGLRPGQPKDLIDSSIIVFNKDSKEDGEHVLGWMGWVERSEKFLEDYNNATRNEGLKACKVKDGTTKKQACMVDVTTLGPCGSGNYGYDAGKPCIFLKLNRIFGLVNEPYTGSEEAPEEMPEGLKAHIDQQSDKDQVWLDCRGKYPADIENLEKTEYFPKSRGFANYYLPYQKQDAYLNPLVAVQFTVNEKADGQLVHIECRAWAKNIGYSRRDKVGIASLELRIMSDKAAKAIKEDS